jgi:Na+-transporting methylmalonyl-CoA/oxaloacetate decarboxylase gamma subunit
MATKLTTRGRSVVRVATCLSLLIVIGAGFSAVGNASERVVRSTPTTSGYQQIVVESGETLWSIASLVAGNRSVSDVEGEIVEANHLNGPDLAAGMRLWVPSS